MSFSAQLPGSLSLSKYEFTEFEMPSAGGALQKSCYSFIEKISGLVNPVSLQHDVMYANAFAAVIDRNELCENETPLALGCVGHQVDKEFPLESKTLAPLPLIMYPSETNGDALDEVDMCAKPVLNWEAYIQDIKAPHSAITSGKRNPNLTGRKPIVAVPKDLQQSTSDPSTSLSISMPSTETRSRAKRPKNVPPEETPTDKDCSSAVVASNDHDHVRQCSSNEILKEMGIPSLESQSTRKNIIHTRPLRKMHIEAAKVESKSKTANISNALVLRKGLPTTITTKQHRQENALTQGTGPPVNKDDRLSLLSWKKLKNQPKLRIEGTWNHLYGGYNGACCFMKDATSKKLCLYLGKGSQLRAVELNDASPSSIFSYSVESVWDEDLVTWSANKLASCNDRDPFDELIFQMVPNEQHKLLGVRRGRSIQIYNTEDDIPTLLESIPNAMYGTSEYSNRRIRKQTDSLAQNPLLHGFDFNPTFGPEVISIDENGIVRVCNMYKRSTVDQFFLPSCGPYSRTVEGYPDFKLNEAIGVSFANHGQLFYGWRDSMVYLGDRRSRKYSRDHITPLFDLRNHVHSHALSSQNHFHQKVPRLNEYTSCVKKSKRDPYYYVGTTSKIYLMDLRVPSHPVIAVNHGLQSPLAYIDICYGDAETFETIIAGSQRSSEIVCMISDLVHLECLQRPGCKGRNPLLYCYPRHLLNPKSYFDAVVNEGYDFPHPVDNDLVKRHFYAWPTGLTACPMSFRGDAKLPEGILVVTSNNFGDVFWQEWGQKPLPSHRKATFADHKLKSFVAGWHQAMKTKIPTCDKIKPSKNPKEFVDSTILVEPLAKGIEKLSRVRDSPFNCFKPDQVQNDATIRAMIPVSDILDTLSKYKSPQVKGIIDVWRECATENPETIELDREQVVVKLEPQEPRSPTSTIEIDISQNEENQLQWDVNQELAQIENALHNTLNIETGASLEDFPQASRLEPGLTPWSEIYSDMFEDSQPSYDVRPTSSRPSLRKSQKARRAGFL